jgi:outer membrane protein assembly factor BamB
MRAALGLLAGRDAAAVPALIDLATGPGDQLAWRAEEVLARLAGDSHPTLPYAAGDAGRASRRAVWRRWWAEQEHRTDLARVDEAPRLLGVTLIPEMHANKVWECGPDGKPLWEIQVPGCPIDAQVLPGGRILVAELNGHVVTERDRTGKVLWTHAVNTPIACQRLANGHTWISTNHRWFVVTPEGKEVAAYEAEANFFIHSVQRQRNGHVVMVSMEGAVREVDAAGKLVREVPLTLQGGWSGVESAPGGHYLAVNNHQGKVHEVDAAGKVVWEYATPGACYAQRLPNGNTLVISNQSGIVEVDRQGRKVWEKPITSSLWRGHRR